MRKLLTIPVAAVSLWAGALGFGGIQSAAAASPNANCVGQIASSLNAVAPGLGGQVISSIAQAAGGVGELASTCGS